jgi:large subunit ribosomal protein L1
VKKMEEKINKALKAALETAPERKFTESVELAFTLRDVDLKIPTNRVQEEIRLPNGRGKDIKIAMFAAGDSASKAKGGDVYIIDPSTIEDLGGNKKTAKKLANDYDYFLSEVPHMGLVGRFLGVVLGPRGKMPRPVPPTVDPSMVAAGLRNTVVVRSRDKMTFHVAIGTKSQSEEELMENVMTVYNRVTSKLERGIGNIRSLYIKTSMGPSVQVEVVN